MLIKHLIKNIELSKEKKNSSFIVTNKKGGYYFGSANENFTKYNGLFFPFKLNKNSKDWDMRKIVDFIGIPENAETIENYLSEVSLTKNNAVESFCLNHSDTLIYSAKNLKKETDILLNLDSKRIYDDSTVGRIYKVSKSKGCIVVSYEKFKDSYLSESDYKFYISIKTDFKCDVIDKWFNKHSPLDEYRGENPYKWIYEAFKFNVKSNKKKGSIVVSYSEVKKKAIEKSIEVFNNIPYIKKMKKKYVESLSETDLKLNKEETLAYKNAIVNFDSLITEVNGVKGIYAGLPWFFQYWARDEAISTIGLIREELFGLTKNILLRWLNGSSSTRIPNRFPDSMLGSADGTGWVFHRLNELITVISKKNKLSEYFNKNELFYVYKECLNKLNNIEDVYLSNGLILNKPLETWMDTGREVGDLRDGFRIEIQSLHISMYNCAINIGKMLKEDVFDLEERKENFISDVKEHFFINDYIYDGLNDSTIRPNLFIAAYLTPEILTKKEWIKCFEKTLPQLYVDFNVGGGITTIDKNSPLYCDTYTGLNNHSYHRGDSWFWVNNLVAVVLSRFGKTKFKKYIDGIKKSSVEVILWKGSVGSFAEVSSASKLTSYGCFSQAWSYALFIELMNE